MPFVPNSDTDRQHMLAKIGVDNFDDLVKSIPDDVRFRGSLDFPEQLSEYEAVKLLKQFASKNMSADSHVCFMGGGAYDRFIPSIIPSTVDRPEFRTAYTPYQAEVSQGTLQTMYEFQSMICELTGMDVANASLYDGGSALAEACLMSLAETGRKKVLIAGTVNPDYIKVTETICYGKHLEFAHFVKEDGTADTEALQAAMNEEVAAVVVQQPNFLGNIEDVFTIGEIAHSQKALFIVSADPISLGILEAPGNYNADIVVGEGQPLGISMSYGGPFLGLFACKKELIRKLPGRIAGVTKDEDGQRAFVLTLQTREQQIKREKATSNICTNQGLFMLAATIYMETMGKKGVKEVAEQSFQKAHYLAEKISALEGYSLVSKAPFFDEFTVFTPKPAKDIIHAGFAAGFLAGIDSSALMGGNNALTIAVTEKRTAAELDAFADFLRTV